MMSWSSPIPVPNGPQARDAENGRKVPEGLRESRHGQRRGSERILGHELQDLMSLSHSGYLSLSDRTRISGPCQSIVSAVSDRRKSLDVDSPSSAVARRRLTARAPVHRPDRTPSAPASPTPAARRFWPARPFPTSCTSCGRIRRRPESPARRLRASFACARLRRRWSWTTIAMVEDRE